MPNKKNILLTGGAGFFGDIIKKELLAQGFNVVSIDLEKDFFKHKNFLAYQGDIRNFELLEHIVSRQSFVAIFHIAAILAHAVKDRNFF